MFCKYIIEEGGTMSKKVLIIGLGGAGQRHLRELRKIDQSLDIYALRQMKTTPTLNEKFEVVEKDISSEYKVKELDNLDEALDLNFDLVIISNPTSLHIKYAELFIDRCKVLLIEKPISSSIENVESFKRKILNSGTKCYVGFQRRFSMCWKEVKKYISEKTNEIGDLKYVTGSIKSYVPEWHSWQDFRDLYATREDLGGGVLLTECHEIDLLHWILGDIINVTAKVANLSLVPLDVEDTTLILGDIKFNDLIVPVSLSIDFMNRNKERKMIFEFQKATIIVDEFENSITVNFHEENTVFKRNFNSENPFEAENRELLRLLENNSFETELATVYDGIKVLSVIEAAKKSSRSGSSCIVEYNIFPNESIVVIDEVVDCALGIFGGDLISIYGMGSLGYGGYVPGWSDWDIDIIVQTTSEQDAIEKYKLGKKIEENLINKGYTRLDIRAYSYQDLNNNKTPSSFGQKSRALMLIDSAKLIYGDDVKQKIERPSKEEMIDESIELIEWMLNQEDDWWKNRPLDDLAAFIALPARFIYSADTGKVAGKKLALEYLLENHKELITQDAYLWVVWAYAKRVTHILADSNITMMSAINAIKELLNNAMNYLKNKEAENG